METFQIAFNIVVLLVCGFFTIVWNSNSVLNSTIKFLMFMLTVCAAVLVYHGLVS